MVPAHADWGASQASGACYGDDEDYDEDYDEDDSYID